MSSEKNITIGKIVLSLMAIGVMFVPVFAVQQIEARTVDHVILLEGMYTNGTALEFADFDNDTVDLFDIKYGAAEWNASETYDSLVYYSGEANEIILRDRATYSGNGTYAMTFNNSEEPEDTAYRILYVPLDINCTEFGEADFYRITSDWDVAPIIYYLYNNNIGEVGHCLEVEEDNYILINTIQTRSQLATLADNDAKLFLAYFLVDEPETEAWNVKIQSEVFTGADVLTWADETLYIMAVMLCDVLLVGAIVFASDPIDIVYDNGKRRK